MRGCAAAARRCAWAAGGGDAAARSAAPVAGLRLRGAAAALGCRGAPAAARALLRPAGPRNHLALMPDPAPACHVSHILCGTWTARAQPRRGSWKRAASSPPSWRCWRSASASEGAAARPVKGAHCIFRCAPPAAVKSAANEQKLRAAGGGVRNNTNNESDINNDDDGCRSTEEVLPQSFPANESMNPSRAIHELLGRVPEERRQNERTTTTSTTTEEDAAAQKKRTSAKTRGPAKKRTRRIQPTTSAAHDQKAKTVSDEKGSVISGSPHLQLQLRAGVVRHSLPATTPELLRRRRRLFCRASSSWHDRGVHHYYYNEEGRLRY